MGFDGAPRARAGGQAQQRARNAAAAAEGRAVYVRGLPPEWSASDVETFLGRHGRLEGVHVLPPRPGQRAGAAFANFVAAGAASEAVRRCDGEVVEDSAGERFWLGCTLKEHVGSKAEIARADFSVPSEVLDGFLFLGNRDNARAESGLRQLGISHVLSILSESEDFAFESDVERLVLHIEDSEHEDISALLGPAYDFLESCRVEGGRVLVHCMAGRSRSPAVVTAYVMRCRRLPLGEAFGLVKRRRLVAMPNEAFWRQLQAEEQRLFGGASCKASVAPRSVGCAGHAQLTLQLAPGALSCAPAELLESLVGDLAEFSARRAVSAFTAEARDEVVVAGCSGQAKANACREELEHILAFYGLMQVSQHRPARPFPRHVGGARLRSAAPPVAGAGARRPCPATRRGVRL